MTFVAFLLGLALGVVIGLHLVYTQEPRAFVEPYEYEATGI
jgi:ABC-type methionine transport system permease subunit